MKKGSIYPYYLIMITLVASGCVTTVQPQKTQLQIREFQTRSYDTSDTKMVMKALLNVLQDGGFIVQNANVDLGLLTASKEIDVTDKTMATLSALSAALGGRQSDYSYAKNSIIEASVNVSPFGKQTRVRVNFQTKKMDNKGRVMTVGTVEDPNYYRVFFSEVDKGIFLQKENL